MDNLTAPPTGTAGLRLGAGLGPGPRAACTALPTGDGHFLLGASGGFLEGNGQIEPQVGATTGTPRSPASETKDVAEDVAEVAENIVEARETRESGVPNAFVSETIVGPSLLVIRKNAIGLRGFLESLLRVGIVRVAVGVMLDGELAVGTFDLTGIGFARNAEYLVVISLRHGLPLPRGPVRRPSALRK